MSKKDPYKGSPYDASGMPLGTEYADYDNFADVAQTTVGDKVPTYPTNINQIDYSEPVIETEPDHTTKGFNGSLAENVNSAYPLDVKTEDLADKGTSRVLYSNVNTEDGTTETIETPRMGNSAFIEQGKADIHDSDNDFLAALEQAPEAPAEPEATPVNTDSSMTPAEPQPAPVEDTSSKHDPEFYGGDSNG